MNFQRALADEAFQTVLCRASALIDAYCKNHAAAEELSQCVARLQAEADALHGQLQGVRDAAEAAQRESVYWRSRAALMIRALRLWQAYVSALVAASPGAQARAFARAKGATAEAMAAISPAALQ